MIKYSKITSQEIRKILELFVGDFSATQTSELLGVSRNTINRYYGIFREEIVKLSIHETKEFGEFEVDESYFGAKRVRGKRGRGAAGKTPVFGLLKRDGKVYVSIVSNCSRESLMPIIQGKVLEGSTIHSDGWKSYDGLILNGYDHYRVFHSENEFVRGKSHVNGIEAFWSFAKRRVSKFNGIQADKFHLQFTTIGVDLLFFFILSGYSRGIIYLYARKTQEAQTSSYTRFPQEISLCKWTKRPQTSSSKRTSFIDSYIRYPSQISERKSKIPYHS